MFTSQSYCYSRAWQWLLWQHCHWSHMMPHNLQAFKLKVCYPGFYILQTYSPVHHLSAPLVQAFVHGCYCTQSYPTIIKVLLMFFFGNITNYFISCSFHSFEYSHVSLQNLLHHHLSGPVYPMWFIDIYHIDFYWIHFWPYLLIFSQVFHLQHQQPFIDRCTPCYSYL